MKRIITSMAVLGLLLTAQTATAQVVRGQTMVRKDNLPAVVDVDGKFVPSQVYQFSLGGCETATGWTVLGTDTTTLAVGTNHVEGLYSLSFAKVDGAADTKLAGAYATLTGYTTTNKNHTTNITDIAENNGVLSASVYVSAITNVDYAFIRLGSSSAAYSEFRLDDSEMAAGWNQFRVPLAKPASVTGAGLNTGSVTYIVVGVAFDAETDALAGILYDNITVGYGQSVLASVDPAVSVILSAIQTAVQYIDDIVKVDDAAFVPGTSKIAMVGYTFDDVSPDSVNEGDAGAARMSANRNIYMTLRDAAGNERGANITAGNALEIDIAEQSLTAVAVSATSAANATANRIYTHANVDQIGGTAVNVNGGAKDGGTQTVTLATDDPAVTSLSTVAGWNNGGNAKIDITAQTLTAVKISDDASANTATNPLYQTPIAATFDDDAAGNCVAITDSSAQFTLPSATAKYDVCCWNGVGYMLAGSNPTATTTVTTGYSMIVADGQCHRDLFFAGTKVAVIGAVSGGSCCFMRKDYP